MEKDHLTATVQSSSAFIVTTNHDEGQEGSVEPCVPNEQAVSQNLQATGMQDLIDDSLERKTMALKFWEESSRMPAHGGSESHVGPITRDTLAEWLGTYPITMRRPTTL